jgi:ABC-type sugar transport system substrate-binding protein
MKNRKRAGRIAATVVASLALALGVSAPASASGTGLLHVGASGYLYCPNFMVARVSFKSTGSGVVWWEHGYEVAFNKTTATHYVYAGISGYNEYAIYIPNSVTVSSVYGTCVV